MKNNFLNITITTSTTLVACIGIAEWFFRKNILYEGPVGNIYYQWYLSQRRIMATQIVPVVLATYLLISLPFCYELIYSTKRKKRLIWGFCLVFILTGIIFTQSRMAMFTLLVISFIYCSFRRPKIRLLSAICLSALIAVSLVTLTYQRFSLSSIREGLVKFSRFTRLEISIAMFKDHPLFGIGLGQYKPLFSQYSHICTGYLKKTPNNMYLMILNEQGFLALISFLLFVAALLIKTFRLVMKDSKSSSVLLVFFCGIISILSMMLIYDALYWTTPFYLFWIFCGILARESNR
jgi:O-antigen ligase